MSAIDDIYTDVINEHSRAQDNRRQLTAADDELRGHNPSCGDDITLQIEYDGGKIKDLAFTGVGCAISQASADIMIDLLRGRELVEAQTLIEKFLSMIKREITDEVELAELEDAIALKNIANMPARVKCAVLAWRTLKDMLAKRGAENVR